MRSTPPRGRQLGRLGGGRSRAVASALWVVRVSVFESLGNGWSELEEMEEIDAWAPGVARTREMRQRRVLWSWLLFRRRMLESSRELKLCRLDRDIPQVWPGEQRFLLISHIGPAMAM